MMDSAYYLQFLEEIDAGAQEVTRWEATFIENLLKNRPATLSPGQQEIVRRMARQYLRVEVK